MKTMIHMLLSVALLPALALASVVPNEGDPIPPTGIDPGGRGTIESATGPWDLGVGTGSASGAVSSTETFRSTGTGNGGQDGTGTMPNPAGTPNPPLPPQR